MDNSFSEVNQKLLGKKDEKMVHTFAPSPLDSPNGVVLKSLTEIDPENAKREEGVEAEVAGPPSKGCYVACVEGVERCVGRLYKTTRGYLHAGVRATVILAYYAYFSYCMYYRFGDEGSILLLIGTSLFTIWAVRKCLASKCHVMTIPKCIRACEVPRRAKRALRWALYLIALSGLVIYIALRILPSHPQNCQSLLGIVVIIVVCFVISTKASRVNWHPVFWGFIIQYVFAMLTLRTKVGYTIFMRLGELVTSLVSFSDYGAAFVLGRNFREMGLAFNAGVVIIFFNAIIFLLIHWGVLENVVVKLGRTLSYCLDTGPVESVVAVANIFIGLAEAPLLVRNYLPTLSKSEICAIMTCGFASVSGGAMGMFISAGAPANHLLTAAVISAPAALAISKLVCPETEPVNFESQNDVRMTDKSSSNRNSLSVCSEGAVAGLKVVGAVMANMMVFVSILKFIDAILGWFALRAGIRGVTFATICAYILYPLSYIMGAEPEDCGTIGTLIGIKLFATPMVGYAELGKLIKNRHKFEDYMSLGNRTWHWSGTDVILDNLNTTLIGGFMSERSEVIATYSMCGFSAFTAIGICIGTMVAMCPARKDDIIEMVLLAFFAGNVASFATGAVAGLLFETSLQK
ncbi:solute carrier family 28 member 3-like [Physella acuta]|uniref:solute carrier family 28 member 3-like n=1 Tax=Physella acuta TaxID=109671 RepID=UPI0027DDF221|nr:solute carrier family 28 member 3-like [Physella acuta]